MVDEQDLSWYEREGRHILEEMSDLLSIFAERFEAESQSDPELKALIAEAKSIVNMARLAEL